MPHFLEIITENQRTYFRLCDIEELSIESNTVRVVKQRGINESVFNDVTNIDSIIETITKR